MMRAKPAAVLVCVALGAAGLAARADVQRLTGDGAVFRVEVDPFGQGGKPSGTVLRTTRQRPRGGKETFFVTGTADAIPDKDPALEIDPSTGQPVVVWARGEAGGFNLFVSSFAGTWAPGRLLIKLDGDDLEPQLRLDHYLHVAWRQSFGGVSTYWRATFDPTTFALLYGPERIPTYDAAPVPQEGGSELDGDIAESDEFFCTSEIGKTMADPSRAQIWGVRDEPVPVGYHRSFVIPAEIRSIVAQGVGFVGGKLTFWYTTTDKLYYTTLSGGRWAESRVVELSPQTSTADALWMIEQSNRRLGGR